MTDTQLPIISWPMQAACTSLAMSRTLFLLIHTCTIHFIADVSVQPLMEAGLDSLGAVELRNQLATEFQAVELPSTLTFDYPTIAALAAFIASQMGPQPSAAATASSTHTSSGTAADPAATQQEVLQIVESMLGVTVDVGQVTASLAPLENKKTRHASWKDKEKAWL